MHMLGGFIVVIVLYEKFFINVILGGFEIFFSLEPQDINRLSWVLDGWGSFYAGWLITACLL